MENAVQLFLKWEQLTPEERAYFAGMVEAFNRRPKETATAPKQKRVRKGRRKDAPPVMAAAAGA